MQGERREAGDVMLVMRLSNIFPVFDGPASRDRSDVCKVPQGLQHLPAMISTSRTAVHEGILEE